MPPHTAQMVIKSEWNLPYSREEAAYPKKLVTAKQTLASGWSHRQRLR
jgi:hypothetical protein